jgi:GT2 family glycosyltransferase
MLLSAIVVSHNTKDILEKSLGLLYKRLSENFSGNDFEIIVVDNASDDKTEEWLQKQQFFKTVFLDKNLGFAAANNRGVKEATGQYLLFVNSDLLLEEEINLVELYEFLKNSEKRAALTVKVILPNGELDPASHRGFPTPWAAVCYFLGLEKLTKKTALNKCFGQYHLTSRNLSQIHEIEALTAAFMLVKKAVFTEVGGFDEDYFMYGEDLDLCYQIKEQGYSIWYYPKYIAKHLKYQSGLKNTDLRKQAKIKKAFYRAMEIFYRKHYEKKYNWMVNKLVSIAIKIKELKD